MNREALYAQAAEELRRVRRLRRNLDQASMLNPRIARRIKRAEARAVAYVRMARKAQA